MNSFENHLQAQLEGIEQTGLLRRLRRVESPQGIRICVDGRDLLNCSSNDYLGLANHAALRDAAMAAVERYGAGSGASRLISGSLSVHGDLEDKLAVLKATEAALAFSSGYSTAMGTLCSILGSEDIVVLDKLVHACIVDAARLSGAKLRVFRHNDLDNLESILKWAANRRGTGRTTSRVLIVTESIFSMDGDLAPLRELAELKNRYGAWLMLDEAHATGVLGPNGSGLAQHLGVSNQIEIQMGTLGKALGAAGGYVCGSRALIDLLVNRARSFIFSTAPVPAAAAAAAAGVDVASSPEGDKRREHLWQLLPTLAGILDHHPDRQPAPRSPIMPWVIGDESQAVATADRLSSTGIYAPAIRYPTVARGSARLRFTLTANHTAEDLDILRQAMGNLLTSSET